MFSLNMYPLFPSYLLKTGNTFKYFWSSTLTSWGTIAMVNCTEILQRSVIGAILPVQDMQVLELKQNNGILTDWVFLYSFADRGTDFRRFTFAIHMLKMILRDFWLLCTKQRGRQNSLALRSTWHWQNRCRPQKCIIWNNTQVGTSASCRIPGSWPFATMWPWNSLDMECI